jgi:hypothetical protein
VLQGDFHTLSDIDRAVEGVRKVILISGDASDQEAKKINLVMAAKKAGVQRILKLSAQSTGLIPPVSFGKKHIQVEKAIEQSGLQWTFIRPVFFQQSFLIIARIVLPKVSGMPRWLAMEVIDLRKQSLVAHRPTSRAMFSSYSESHRVVLKLLPKSMWRRFDSAPFDGRYRPFATKTIKRQIDHWCNKQGNGLRKY